MVAVGGVGDVLACVSCVVWVGCLRGWCASMGGMLLLLLLLKCYPEEQNVDCLHFKQK